MDTHYYLYSGRLSGWLSASGTYVSRISEARLFNSAEAFEYCKMHYANGLSEYGLIPVREEDLERVRS